MNQKEKHFLEKNKPLYVKPLRNGYSLSVKNKENMDVIHVRNNSGMDLFTIEVSDQGTSLNIAAENINLQAADTLKLKAKNVEIESEKTMKLKSEGDFSQRIAGNRNVITQGESVDLAKTQHIEADIGDVELKANDDVVLDGERIRLNSPRPSIQNNTIKK